jgi:hypothetical protein
MQTNHGIQTAARQIWDGANAVSADTFNFTGHSFVFYATDDVDVAAVFAVETAPGSGGDPCVAGAFEPLIDIGACDRPVADGTELEITIPAGTLAGTYCSIASPCRGNRHVRLTSVSGDTDNVEAILLMHGPRN